MRPYALVVANDEIEPEKMLWITEQVSDYVDGVKIGITSSIKPGVGIFEMVKKMLNEKSLAVQITADYKVTEVLGDFKVADIGFKDKEGNWQGTNEKIVRTLSDAGTDYITCHTITGISSIEESLVTAHKYGSKVLTLPYMTHKGANLFFGMPIGGEQVAHILSEFESYGLEMDDGLEKTIKEKVNTITDLILALGNHFGVDGYIGPGNDPDILKRYRHHTYDEIWSPGFGRQDKMGRDLETQIAEWAKIVGPNSAMIVGSLIFKAKDPAKAAKMVMETRDRVIKKLRL